MIKLPHVVSNGLLHRFYIRSHLKRTYFFSIQGMVCKPLWLFVYTQRQVDIILVPESMVYVSPLYTIDWGLLLNPLLYVVVQYFKLLHIVGHLSLLRKWTGIHNKPQTQSDLLLSGACGPAHFQENRLRLFFSNHNI